MKNLLPVVALLFFAACKNKTQYNADLIVKNAVVYTVDSAFSTAQAFAIANGKIIAVGSSDSIEQRYSAKNTVDAGGKAVYPGFIDGHAHFFEYGQALSELDLGNTTSWQQIVDSVNVYGKRKTDGWIIGDGWDQNKWKVKQFPNKAKLDSLFPMRPVLLTRVDGHAAIANQAALNIAGVKPNQQIVGGTIETINGKLTGVLVDNAVGIVRRKIPSLTEDQIDTMLMSAQKNCFAAGLTTVDDMGLPNNMIGIIEQLQHKGELKMRLYVLLSDRQENYDYLFKRGIIKTPYLSVRGFKVYADGALGSKGACLLQPYSDNDVDIKNGKNRPKDWKGFLLSKPEHFQQIAQKLADSKFQMCTHAIGDSANRTILKIYASVLKGKNDRRWRIEHAQIIDPADVRYFGDDNIVPSVQPTHATSDMKWAADRLGKQRLKNAYIYKQLLEQNGWEPLGTDFPVESINPMYTFYAAVVRKDRTGYPASGFQMENALSREQALRGMTIWAAKANFEEKEKGSIEPGKYADFVILNQDIMKADDASLPKVKVVSTYVNGEKVYDKK